ncbi:MAG: cupin domain-containing protein [Candidatus Krumholzibacteria bacterium]|jgi:transcriptional regulator with XRE-family HTH domain|nr:cupin domain-containing protein [Candidatus Krumholzibacteria bacterium]MDP6669127.1 cupin domain-containing protein [Candidatus Krumholzibacteria bacterium]MDP6797705.1 cupin domain-containing protein [Candidatus Krumholzibacteria bacterium]MDP7022558.1 cupin domain-containing protein [Candidatus Krumholzibacteria bacterium]
MVPIFIGSKGGIVEQLSKAEIGERLKRFRLSKKLTLKNIEASSGVSATHISEIERGKSSPTVGALDRIARAMGSEPSYFVEVDELPSSILLKADNRRRFRFLEPPVEIESLSGSIPHSRISFMKMTWEKGAVATGEVNRHEGEEFILLLKGILEVNVDNERQVLKEGDSLHYHASSPHRIENIGDGPCEAWVVTVPSFKI